MEVILKGKACVFGDYTDSYQIIPEAYWKGGTKIGNLDAEELGKHAMEGADPGFPARALAGEFSFVVAGRNFGGAGKSIEHPIFALKGARVKAVIAESCARYFFRNAINNGLPAMTCEGITAKVKTGDELEVNLGKGEIRNITTAVTLRSDPLPELAMEILKAGGLIPYLKKRHHG